MIGNMLVGHLIHQQQELFESYIVVTEGYVCKSLHPVASVDTVHHPVLVEVPVIYEFEVRYLFHTGGSHSFERHFAAQYKQTPAG